MQTSTAKRYATAIFEIAKSHAQDPDQGLQNYGKYLKELEHYLTYSHHLKVLLLNPAVPLSKRHDLVREIGEKSQWSKLFCNFVCLLIDRSKLNAVQEIHKAYDALIDDYQGVIRMKLTSARPLKAAEVQKIVNALPGISPEKVKVDTDLDPELIGGVVAQVGEKIYDASIRTQLDKIKQSFLEKN